MGIILSNLSLDAQQSKFPIVVGVEYASTIYSINYIKLSDNFKYEIGVTSEFPFNQFSVGTGILFKSYGDEQSIFYTGESFEDIVKGNEKTFFNTYEVERSIQYITIPLRLQYRLPCNCVYVQAGVEANFLTQKSPTKIQGSDKATTRHPNTYESKSYKRKNVQFDFGIGFKLHQTEQLRIFMRPSYQILLTPYTADSNLKERPSIHALRMAFGFQFGVKKKQIIN